MHRLLARWQVPTPAGQQRQATLQSGQERGGWERLDARGGELNGQRESVQVAADGGDRCRVILAQSEVGDDCLRPRHEETLRR